MSVAGGSVASEVTAAAAGRQGAENLCEVDLLKVCCAMPITVGSPPHRFDDTIDELPLVPGPREDHRSCAHERRHVGGLWRRLL